MGADLAAPAGMTVLLGGPSEPWDVSGAEHSGRGARTAANWAQVAASRAQVSPIVLEGLTTSIDHAKIVCIHESSNLQQLKPV